MRRHALVLGAAVVACGSPTVPVEPPPRASASSAPRAGDGAPLLPDGRIAATSVAVMGQSVCALLVDGTVWCFGRSFSDDRGAHVVHEMPIPKARSLVATTSATYALAEDGHVYVWGYDARLGKIDVPRALDADGVSEVAASVQATCLRRGSIAECRRPSGEAPFVLADDAVAISTRPREACAARPTTVACQAFGLPPSPSVERRLPDVVELAASDARTCARSRAGRVKCWKDDELVETDLFGPRAFSALEGSPWGICAVPAGAPRVCVPDDADAPDAELAVAIADALRPHRNLTRVALGPSGACFVDAGVVHCWGESDVLGRATAPRAIDLGDLASLRSARDVAVAPGRTCIVGTDDAVRCWGDTTSGATGLPTDGGQLGPARVPGLPPVAYIASHANMNCYVTREIGSEVGGRLFCAGGFSDLYGRSDCADPRFPCRREATLVTTGVRDVALGDGFACVLDADTGVRCWGRNDDGQLGTGDFDDAPSPRPVLVGAGHALRGARKIVAGRRHVCALVDSDLACWGYDDPGVQGRAVPPAREMAVLPVGWGMARNVATPVPTEGRVRDVSARCVILAPADGERGSAGEVRCWGPDLNGNFAVTPARVGACDATQVVDACALGGRGVVCPTRGAKIQPPYTGPAITSFAVDDLSVCWVDADHRVACRDRDDDTPRIGALQLGPYAPTSACPAEPTRGARPPIASWAGSEVSGPFSAHALSLAEIQTLVDVWSGPDLESCQGPTPGVTFRFTDAWHTERTRLVYVGAPCEGLMDETDPLSTSKKLTPEGLALVKAMLARPPQRRDRDIP